MNIKYKGKEIKAINCISFYQRFKGFMLCKNIDKALIFKRCNAIHTCFMLKNIDVIMCDNNYRVLYIYRDFKPWKMIFPKKGVSIVIESPANYFDINIGDIMEVIE